MRAGGPSESDCPPTERQDARAPCTRARHHAQRRCGSMGKGRLSPTPRWPRAVREKTLEPGRAFCRTLKQGACGVSSRADQTMAMCFDAIRLRERSRKNKVDAAQRRLHPHRATDRGGRDTRKRPPTWFTGPCVYAPTITIASSSIATAFCFFDARRLHTGGIRPCDFGPPTSAGVGLIGLRNTALGKRFSDRRGRGELVV